MSNRKGVSRVDMLDVAAHEAAERQLEAIVERRVRETEDAGRVEELWRESVRRFHGERHNKNAQAFYDHHCRQLAAHGETFSQLLAHHRSERDRYGRMLGINVPDDGPVVA
jgi:hypothetical protein